MDGSRFTVYVLSSYEVYMCIYRGEGVCDGM